MKEKQKTNFLYTFGISEKFTDKTEEIITENFFTSGKKTKIENVEGHPYCCIGIGNIGGKSFLRVDV